MKFIIEHLEPELFDWCLIEYEHISKIVGKNNLIFTNIKNGKNKNTVENLRFSGHRKSDECERVKRVHSHATGFPRELKKHGTIFEKNISELNFKNICVLSQYSKKQLKTNDKNKFQYLVFGGILGDEPAKKRTIDIIQQLKKHKIKFETRNLGDKQMPTDVAVYVAKKILEGNSLEDFKFVDELEIEINENECINLPFRYVVDKNKLIIYERLIQYLRKRDKF